MAFTDLLAFLVGEGVDIRVHGGVQRHKNRAPCFLSGRKHLKCPRLEGDPTGAAEYDGMMLERWETFHFTQPLPKAQQIMNWPICGRCGAAFYWEWEAARLQAEAAGPPRPLAAAPAELPQPLPAAPAGEGAAAAFLSQLDRLGEMRVAGLLSDEEFTAAKRQLLGLTGAPALASG